MTMTTTITQPVKATLVLVPEHGPKRDATPGDLREMGYVPRRDVYYAADLALTRIMGVGDDDRRDLTRWREGDSAANLVRYFIEVVVMYHDLDGPAETPEEMADQIVAHFAGGGGNEDNGPALRAMLGIRSCADFTAGDRVKVNGYTATVVGVNPTRPADELLVEHDDGSWTVASPTNDTITKETPDATDG